jgi:hypothetical protein
METAKYSNIEGDRKIWFSMWFLASIVTFGLTFFPMFHRLISNRNNHFQREATLDEQITAYLKSKGKEPPKMPKQPSKMNTNAWTAAILLILPAFAVTFLLSRDLAVHEVEQDRFLAEAFPERMFMPQTIQIKTYAVITIVTLGVGIIYWLYKVVNLYNAHFKAHMQVETQIRRLMEEQKPVEHM